MLQCKGAAGWNTETYRQETVPASENRTCALNKDQKHNCSKAKGVPVFYDSSETGLSVSSALFSQQAERAGNTKSVRKIPWSKNKLKKFYL